MSNPNCPKCGCPDVDYRESQVDETEQGEALYARYHECAKCGTFWGDGILLNDEDALVDSAQSSWDWEVQDEREEERRQREVINLYDKD